MRRTLGAMLLAMAFLVGGTSTGIAMPPGGFHGGGGFPAFHGESHGFHGHGFHPGHHAFVHGGVVIGAPFGFGAPFWWGWRDPSVPPAYAQPAPGGPGYWYYCQNPPGYYPYVQACPGGWLAVAPPPTG